MYTYIYIPGIFSLTYIYVYMYNKTNFKLNHSRISHRLFIFALEFYYFHRKLIGTYPKSQSEYWIQLEWRRRRWWHYMRAQGRSNFLKDMKFEWAQDLHTIFTRQCHQKMLWNERWWGATSMIISIEHIVNICIYLIRDVNLKFSFNAENFILI